MTGRTQTLRDTFLLLRELLKDEVRALGRELGLPDDMVGRHPFPGPGLAIRIPGEVTREPIQLPVLPCVIALASALDAGSAFG